MASVDDKRPSGLGLGTPAEQQSGLGLGAPSKRQRRRKVPPKIEHQEKDLITSVLQTPPPRAQAASLTFTDSTGMLDGIELLEQVQHEVQRLSEMGNGNKDNRGTIVDVCLALAKNIRATTADHELEYMSKAYDLMMLFYFFGKLTSPNQQICDEMTQSFIANIRRKKGIWSTEADKECGRNWMREKAAEIWSQDYAQEKRIGKVVEELQALIEEKAATDEVVNKYWAKSYDAIRKAIREVAPGYALKQGRPRKK